MPCQAKVPRPPADGNFYVAIPSYKRENLIQSKTLAVLQRQGVPHYRVYIFVASESQYDVYRRALGQQWPNIIVGVPTLWRQRNFITKFFAEGTHILSMDDDVEDLYLCDPLTVKSSPDVRRLPLPAGGLAEIAAEARQKMQLVGSYIWSLNVSDNPFFMRHSVLLSNGLCNGFFWGCINRHDEDLALKHGDGHEDVERSVRYFAKDGVVLRYSYLCARSKCKLNPGGLQASMTGDQRAKEEERSAVLLVQEFPHLVKLVPGSILGLKFYRISLAGHEMLSVSDLAVLVGRSRTNLLEGAVWAAQADKARVITQSGTFRRCTQSGALLQERCGGYLVVSWYQIYRKIGSQDLRVVWLPEDCCKELGLEHKPRSSELEQLLRLGSNNWAPSMNEGASGRPLPSSRARRSCPSEGTANADTAFRSPRRQLQDPLRRRRPGVHASLGRGVDTLLEITRKRRAAGLEADSLASGKFLALEDVSKLKPAAPGMHPGPKLSEAEEPAELARKRRKHGGLADLFRRFGMMPAEEKR